MKRIVFLICATLLTLNSAYAVEFKPLELPKQEPVQEEVSVPKALLNDDNYKIKGRVEYDSDGVLFLEPTDIDELKLQVNVPKSFPKKSVLSDGTIFSKIEEQRRYETPNVDEYLISPISGELKYTNGKYSYGTTFGTDIDSAQVEYRTKMFARYDNKRFGFMTAVSKDAYTTSGKQVDNFYIVPELKLTQGLSLVNAFKATPESEKFQNEVSLKYSPKIKNSRDNVSLEAGVSQTSYYNSGEQLYQFSVSTKFRF